MECVIWFAPIEDWRERVGRGDGRGELVCIAGTWKSFILPFLVSVSWDGDMSTMDDWSALKKLCLVRKSGRRNRDRYYQL